MSSHFQTATELLVAKLAKLVSLDESDRAALNLLRLRLEDVSSSYYLVREGDEAKACCLLVDGYACRHKVAADGARQIVSFHMPGDIVDLQHLLFSRADHNVQTLTGATVAWIGSSELKRLYHQHPKIGEALWRDTLIDASIFREWVLNVGRRDAKTRVAHMLCEFMTRREAAGLGPPQNFELPMTQEQIADATGMTSVHVNRTLRSLREDGVIEHQGRQINVTDWPRLRSLAGFDPAYLHALAG